MIIADDFTGALDTGVKFAANGATTYVMVDFEIDYAKITSNIEVLVIDAETRHLDKTAAYLFSIVKEASRIANKACENMGITIPRVAVAGLNPHSGENGLFGRMDHGTGFDQAGKGTSNELSLMNAIEYAIQMANNKFM